MEHRLLQQDHLQHKHHRPAWQYRDDPVHQRDRVGNLHLAHYVPCVSLACQGSAAGMQMGAPVPEYAKNIGLEC